MVILLFFIPKAYGKVNFILQMQVQVCKWCNTMYVHFLKFSLEITIRRQLVSLMLYPELDRVFFVSVSMNIWQKQKENVFEFFCKKR